MLFKNTIIISVCVLFFGCTNDSTSDLIYQPVPVLNTTYSINVKRIIDDNCVRCHTAPPINGAPMQLLTYEDVKNAVINRGLINRISRQSGEPGLMPNGGPRLPQSAIDVVIRWRDEGFPQ